MGFEKTMNAILENLPQEDRQTLLFSATQTRSVKDLARLSLEKPIYVSVHENADKATPDKLCEKYMRIELHDKINLLWSFIKSHKRQKLLVFMQSCKQVKVRKILKTNLKILFCSGFLIARSSEAGAVLVRAFFSVMIYQILSMSTVFLNVHIHNKFSGQLCCVCAESTEKVA